MYMRRRSNTHEAVPLHVGADARAGVVQCSSQGTARREIGLSGDAAAVSAAIDRMRQFYGGTDIQEGLQLAQVELAANGRAGAQPLIILMTDGGHNQPGDPVAEANAAKAAGTRIFAMGVGSAVDGAQLRAIASDPDSDNVFTVRDFRSLEAVLGQLVGNVCNAPVLPADELDTGDPPAFVTVAQHPTPNVSMRPGSIITHTIVVSNRGEGGAELVLVTMPFNPAAVQVLDATFSRSDAWVSQLLTDTLTFETGRYGSTAGC